MQVRFRLRAEVLEIRGDIGSLKAEVVGLKSEVEVAKSESVSKALFEELSVRVGELEVGGAELKVRTETDRNIRVQLDAQDPARKKIVRKGF